MISIVIVNWNSGGLLEKCIRSLSANAEDCQVTIVDNASADSSLDFLDCSAPVVSILRNERNLGFAAGCNLGWRASNGDHVLFLNPDTECLPGSASRLQHTFELDPTIWAAGGRLIHSHGKSRTDFNVRSFPSLASVAADAFFIEEIWPSNPWSHLVRLDEVHTPVDVDQPAAACLMVSKTALESTGGFDENFYPAWFEDVDLCRRIRQLGGRIRYQPEAEFVHHGGYSLELMSRQDFLESFHTNQIRYFLKHHGPGAAARVRRLILAGLYLRTGLSMIHSPVRGLSRAAAVQTFWNAARYIADFREAGK